MSGSSNAKGQSMPGPLSGLKVLEIASIGPGPFCCMMLADLGADVIRVSRCEEAVRDVGEKARFRVMERNRRSIAVDLKSPEGVEIVLKLAQRSDVLVEGFRPGKMERLGLGPEPCLSANPRLVYGRMTGWGQDGPLSGKAGHDINYIALSGALHGIGTAEAPVPPLNLVGDFGGGGMLLALGVVSAVLEARTSGRGQVVDAAMVDGSSLLMSVFYGRFAEGIWRSRGENLLDGSAHFYSTYQCADGKWISVGPIEEKFYRQFLDRLAIQDIGDWPQHNPADWPDLRNRLAEEFMKRSRDDWIRVFEKTDACVAPVLDMVEAPDHPHAKSRSSFVNLDGVVQPVPAPRFSESKTDIPEPPHRIGADTDRILGELGYDKLDILKKRERGCVG